MATKASSAIDKIDYHSGSKVMTVWFSGRSEPHVFHGVPELVHEAFRKAPSKGSFYHQHIRGNYPAK